MKKLLILTIFTIIFFSINGCTLIDGAGGEEFLELKETYGVSESFSQNMLVMNSYISDLSELRGQSDFFSRDIISVELNTAKAFYYLHMAFDESRGLTYTPNHCTTIAYKNTIKYLKLAEEYSKEGLRIKENISDNEFLRNNQKEILQEIYSNSTESARAIKETC